MKTLPWVIHVDEQMKNAVINQGESVGSTAGCSRWILGSCHALSVDFARPRPKRKAHIQTASRKPSRLSFERGSAL